MNVIKHTHVRTEGLLGAVGGGCRTRRGVHDDDAAAEDGQVAQRTVHAGRVGPDDERAGRERERGVGVVLGAVVLHRGAGATEVAAAVDDQAGADVDRAAHEVYRAGGADVDVALQRGRLEEVHEGVAHVDVARGRVVDKHGRVEHRPR